MLRPTFYRLRGCPRVFSGYYRHSALQHAQFEAYTYPDEALTAADALQHEYPSAAGAIRALTPMYQGLVKIPLGLAAPGLLPCAHVEFTDEVDLFPITVIERMERGIVTKMDNVTGEVAVFLTQYHSGLDDISNCVTLTPHQVEEAHLAAITILKPGYADLFAAAERARLSPVPGTVHHFHTRKLAPIA